MRHRTLFMIAALVAVVVVGSAGMYLYDSSQSDVIAKGVKVNGIDLGGLNTEQARTKVQTSIMGTMNEPIVVKASKTKFHLSAKRARVSVNFDAMVNEALRKSRNGNVVTRTWRSLTGEEASADLRPSVSYSQRVVDTLVDRIKRTIDRPAQNAAVVPSPTDLGKTRGRTGLKVDARSLTGDIQAELGDPTAGREIVADITKTKPEVSRSDLARKYPSYLTVSKDQTKLRLWRNLKLEKTYGVAVGQPAWPTSDGLFTIQDKTVDPTWSVPNSSWAGDLAGSVIPGGAPDNPLKARWMGFNNGQGIHGTSDVNSIGTAASHGCIRMQIEDVKDLYPRVDVGTPIFIG